MTLARSSRENSRLGLQDPNDNSKDPKGTCKDLDNQNLDEQRAILSISQSTAAANDTHRHTTSHVAHANSNSSSQHSVACRLQLGNLHGSKAIGVLELRIQDDGDDDTVDGHSLAKDDADQVLASDLRGTDGSTSNTSSSQKDAPGSPNDGKPNGDGRAKTSIGPGIDVPKDVVQLMELGEDSPSDDGEQHKDDQDEVDDPVHHALQDPHCLINWLPRVLNGRGDGPIHS
mmetsp:Transcript_116888/g.203416  ORF Transcript_116888/g.203416 Transcript_116888/m.203416 type:complete len:230 (+) Transcript_116888:258-947(+)